MEHFNNGFNLIDKAHIETVKQRFLRISDAIEKSYYCDNFIKRRHSYFVGSYGRNTAINTSDIDIMVVLPNHVKKQFDGHNGNGESHLLQAIKGAILKTYPNTKIRADGQVVVVDFTDGMKFEVLPGFDQGQGDYYYPDTHNGGSWKLTSPFRDQVAMMEVNKGSKGLLYDTCRYIRYIRDECFNDMKLSGIVIDSFVFQYTSPYEWADNKNHSNQFSLCDYVQYLRNQCIKFKQDVNDNLVLAPGAMDLIPAEDSYECLFQVLCEWLYLEKANDKYAINSLKVTKGEPLLLNYTGETIWPAVLRF